MEEGQQEFINGNFDTALEVWSRHLKSCEFIENGKPDVLILKKRLLLNLSLVCLKLNNYEKAKIYADQVLLTTPDDIKALYRAALASSHLKSTIDSEEYLKRILKIDPDNKPALILMHELRNNKKRTDGMMKKMSRKIIYKKGEEESSPYIYIFIFLIVFFIILFYIRKIK